MRKNCGKQHCSDSKVIPNERSPACDTKFSNSDPIIIPELFSQEHCKLLTRWMLRDVVHERRSFGDAQVSRCVSFPQPSFQKNLLVEYISSLESVVGARLVPSYAFGRVYLHGAILHKHTDRKECELTASICVGNSNILQWPLYLQINAEEAMEVSLDVGAAVIFDGRKLAHWRNELKHDWSAYIFLHYYVYE